MINTTLKNTLQVAMLFCFLNCSYAFASTNSASASVLRFQTKMAERGAVESQYKLGYMHETGSGIKQNLNKAKHWYEKASAQGFQPASNRLMYLQIKNTGIKNHHIHWLSTLKSSAKSNDKEALFLLGQMYAEGTGVNKSLTLSLKLLRKALRKNITSAEPHISRIERELAALQQEYAVPQASESIRKLSSNTNKVATKKLNTPNILKNIKKAPSAVKPQSRYQNKPKIKAPVIAQTQIKYATPAKQKPAATQHKKITQATTYITSATALDEPQYRHPMDMMCGGSNRFKSGCR